MKEKKGDSQKPSRAACSMQLHRRIFKLLQNACAPSSSVFQHCMCDTTAPLVLRFCDCAL